MMREGTPSATAQRVAGYRVAFEREPTPFGDPSADDLLAQDVVGSLQFTPRERMARYLKARTAFFDRVVINGLGRGVSQIACVGAGYDGRSLRYAKPAGLQQRRVESAVVTRTRELDVGVLRVERRDGPDWIARVFPASRPLDASEGDAAILQFLERAEYPAERCAHPEPVTVYAGQAVVVTEYVPGRPAKPSAATFSRLGDLLGRLHAFAEHSAAARRPGGGWHHLVFQGSRLTRSARASHCSTPPPRAS
jgi:hypothetical protein